MGSVAVPGQPWGRAAHDWSELQEPMAQPLWETMLAAAAVGPGTRLLDAGCGAGGASALAAGRGAQVNGIDAAPALVAIARERVPDGDFRVGDLETLPYADETFDAIIAADVLPYLADPLAALRELRRVCTPRGRVVLAIWGMPRTCAQHAIAAAVRAILPRSLDEERERFGGSLSAPGVLEALIARAGLTVRGGGTVACTYAYADHEMAWQAQASSGPLQAACHAVGEQRLRAAVLGVLAPYTSRTGAVRVPNSFRHVTALPG